MRVHANELAEVEAVVNPLVTCKHEEFTPRTHEESAAAWQRSASIIDAVLKQKLSFSPRNVLETHAKLVLEIEALGVPGMILECGVAKGGSALVLAAAKKKERCLHLFDTFTGIPQPSSRDGEDVHQRYARIQQGKAGRNYYGYMKNLLVHDKLVFSSNGLAHAEHSVTFHKGLFNETVKCGGKVAYAHLDGDWYESVRGVLVAIEPYLVTSGLIVFDDVSHWSGAKTAFEEFFGVDIGEGWKPGEASMTATTKRGSLFELFVDKFSRRYMARRLANSDKELNFKANASSKR